jgi:hypothetical protein
MNKMIICRWLFLHPPHSLGAKLNAAQELLFPSGVRVLSILRNFLTFFWGHIKHPMKITLEVSQRDQSVRIVNFTLHLHVVPRLKLRGITSLLCPTYHL